MVKRRDENFLIDESNVVQTLIHDFLVPCSIFSIIFLFRNLKSRRSALVLSLSIAIVVAYLLFMVAVERTENKVIDRSVKILLLTFIIQQDKIQIFLVVYGSVMFHKHVLLMQVVLRLENVIVISDVQGSALVLRH